MNRACFAAIAGAALACSGALAQTFDAPEIVAQVQTSLAARGFSPGPADGVMRRETLSALQQLQRSQSLPPTGYIDERTLAALGLSIQRAWVAPEPALSPSELASTSGANPPARR